MGKIKEKSPKTNTKTQQIKSGNGGDAEKPAIWQDERFQHLVSDPRFRSLPQTQRKVKIDKRFQGMFDDDKFKVKYTVDKYGRRVNKSNSEDLKKYYEIETSSDEEDAEKVEEEQRAEEKAITRDDGEDSGESTPSEEEPGENDALESDGEEVPRPLKERLLDPNVDYARGEGRLVTDSSSDDESSEEEDPVLMLDHVWGELDCDAERTDESTRRLAVCNMDWDRIRAVDLMVLFSSFLPPGGSVTSVRIYPSQFGKERMAEEEVHGPQELVGLGKEARPKKQSADSDGDDEDIVPEQDSDAEEGDEYHMEKLRQYQLNRLRYYYAVVECDSVATADKVYQECDGIEYESSATRVDLRFIPDDTTFDEDEPSDECTELPDTNTYKPRQFTTTALQQAKVNLTWDETAVERKELGDKLSSGKYDEVSDKDLRKIVAYSSEEEVEDEGTEGDDESEPEEAAVEEEEAKKKEAVAAESKGKPKKAKKENMINKYKALLAEINEKEKAQKNKKYEMEYTWTVNEDKQEKDDKDVDPKTKEKPKQLTPIEKVLQKRNEKNRKRKEERKKKKLGITSDDSDQLDADGDDSDVPDGIDMNDPYFAEEFANGDFIDPAANKKKDKKKKSKGGEDDPEEEERRAKELQLLLDDDDEENGKQHFSLEKIMKAEQETKSKKKRRKQLKKSKGSITEAAKEVEDTFQINVKDDRFKAIYSSHLYNIDPTDSHFKKTKGMEQIISEKFKLREGGVAPQEPASAEADDGPKRPKKQVEDAVMVKNLKRKIQLKQEGALKRVKGQF